MTLFKLTLINFINLIHFSYFLLTASAIAVAINSITLKGNDVMDNTLTHDLLGPTNGL